ncbi:MAG TPA: FAD-dependent oxidoreductase [Vicinamibacteria bacterium]|nr:FAD-dependent oxidoreductase [Vicinamibacteria bacterium]
MSADRADLVVIGGGIVGAATAFYAARAGLTVMLVERRSGLATLTTTRSLEGVRAQFDDAEDIAMMRESLEVFEGFAEIVGVPGLDVSFHQQGYLFLSQTAEGASRIAARVRCQHAAGLDDVELLTGPEARRRFPFLADDLTAASFRQRDGWVASHEVTYGFVAGARDRATVRLETEVVGLDVGQGRLRAVVTSRGRIETPRAVIAAGPFSGRVAALAGLAIPFFALRRHRAGIKAHPLIPRGAPMTISLDTGAHWRPEGPGAWFGWSGALDEQPEEPREDVPAEWTFPALALEAVARFTPFWDEVAATLTQANVTVEAGQYDMTRDAKPLIGPTEIDGLYLNAGYSGHGVMGSPAGARLCVDVMLGRVTPAQNAFRPSRFQEGEVAAKKPL